MMHTRPQVDVLTCTFLILTSPLCSTGIAALWRHKHFWFLHLLSTSSDISLSFLSLYCSLLRRIHSSVSIQHEQWTPPSINQLKCVETVIYLDNSPWHKPLHIPNMAKKYSTPLTFRNMNHYTYQISQSSNLRRELIRAMNHYMHLYGSTVINVNCTRSMVNLMLEAYVRHPLYIVVYRKRVHYTADSLVWDSLKLTPVAVLYWFLASTIVRALHKQLLCNYS